MLLKTVIFLPTFLSLCLSVLFPVSTLVFGVLVSERFQRVSRASLVIFSVLTKVSIGRKRGEEK